jgi:hypothetical protein
MQHAEFTKDLIASFVCEEGKNQSLYWDGACPGLGVRVTQAGARSFIFDSRVRRSELRLKCRITIGSVKTWTIAQAREVAKRYKRLTDSGIDPRDVIAR